jgi:hypothetical protein
MTGCATKYQDMGFGGGVSAQQITSDTWRIEARGNGYTARNVVEDYAVLKAAETTKAAGGTHFVVIGQGDASSETSVVSPGYAQTRVFGNSAYTNYTPATVIPIFKPGKDTVIKVLKIAPPQSPPPGAISADEIIEFVGRRVQRG